MQIFLQIQRLMYYAIITIDNFCFFLYLMFYIVSFENICLRDYLKTVSLLVFREL